MWKTLPFRRVHQQTTDSRHRVMKSLLWPVVETRTAAGRFRNTIYLEKTTNGTWNISSPRLCIAHWIWLSYAENLQMKRYGFRSRLSYRQTWRMFKDRFNLTMLFKMIQRHLTHILGSRIGPAVTARLPPMCPIPARCHVGWVCCWFSPCSEGFSPGSPVFLPGWWTRTKTS